MSDILFPDEGIFWYGLCRLYLFSLLLLTSDDFFASNTWAVFFTQSLPDTALLLFLHIESAVFFLLV